MVACTSESMWQAEKVTYASEASQQTPKLSPMVVRMAGTPEPKPVPLPQATPMPRPEILPEFLPGSMKFII